MWHPGGGLFGIFGSYTNRLGKDPVVLLGMLTHFAVYLLVYYNLPNDSSTNEVSILQSFGALINPSKWVHMAWQDMFDCSTFDITNNVQLISTHRDELW